MHVEIGQKSDGRAVALPLRTANRHGLVTGATGVGKTTTLQRLAEEFSEAGVPVFAADVKGDLSGIAAEGDPNGAAATRAKSLGANWAPGQFPVAFWDLFGVHGLPIRTSVQDMGATLLSAMLRLNEVQSGTLAIAFRIAEETQDWLLTLDDLRWALNEMLELREEVCRKHGNITASSIAAIQRNLLALEAQGGDRLFGEPPFDIMDLMRVDSAGRGVVNLLHADALMEAPKLYATFLLWLLTELFRRLPEAGDLEKPRLVFFFDEAHLLFTDAPKPLLQSIERLVRLVRSKGVGVFFVTQSPADVPDVVLAQLGTRIQHALRAYTQRDQKMVRAAAGAFRPNPNIDARAAITEMGIGEALVSVLQTDGTPSPVERVMIYPPAGQIGPVSDLEREAAIAATPDAMLRYRNVLEPHEASYAFNRRMAVARGIDPGPDTGPVPYEADAWRAFIPQIGPPRMVVDPGHVRLELLKIAAAFAISAASFGFIFLL